MAEGISTISGSIAKRAYGAGTKVDGGLGPEISPSNGQNTFAAMVRESASNSMDVLRNADMMTERGLKGEVPVQSVIEATMAAEATLTTVVAVRDKLVQAYQEIVRMPL